MKKISRFAWFFGSLILALGVTGCVTNDSSRTSSSEIDSSIYVGLGTFKGLEAYCWRENETWACGLMSGTNRNKAPSEVDALPGLSLSRMSAVLQTYTDPDVQVFPLFVSRPCQDSELSARNSGPDKHPEIVSYLYGQLGLTNDGHVATSSVTPRHNLRVESDSKDYLKQPLEGSYPSGSWIEATSHIVMDADLELHLNGSLASRSYMFHSENAWTYHFQMPDQDSLVSFVSTSPSYIAFEDAYPWSKGLTEDDISKIDYVGSDFDIGPGGMNAFYHGDSFSDKAAFLSYSQDHLLCDTTLAMTDGGYSETYYITVDGIRHSLSINGNSLDNKYLTSKKLAKPLVFDYLSFIPYDGVRLWDQDHKIGHYIKDSSFFDDVHFVSFTYGAAPSLLGSYFEYGAGINFIDGKHFKYGKDYYLIVSEQDFSSYLNG